MQQSWLIAAILLSIPVLCSSQFSDYQQKYEEECIGEDKFHCNDGECIPATEYCDNITNCVDGSDESFCPGESHSVKEIQCNSTHEYTCKDRSRCIPYAWVCNTRPECDDASDEKDCKSITTTTEQPSNGTCSRGFTCDKNRCISGLWVCDNKPDCDDGSDETRQACKITDPTVGANRMMANFLFACEPLVQEDRLYECRDKSFCALEQHMCDGIKDCRDGSDEEAFCANWTTMCDKLDCGTNNASCRRDRNGPYCECSEYHRYDAPTKTCVDVDECSLPAPVCSHQCRNLNGSYECPCDEGFHRHIVPGTCDILTNETMVFYTTLHEIGYVTMSVRKNFTKKAIAVTGIKQAHGVAYDGTYLYWAETADGHESIVRAVLTDVNNTKETLVALGLEDPSDIALDYGGGHLYWSDADTGRIAVCERDGAICTMLNTTARHPRFLQLHADRGMMYWADWINKPVIMRANMDGTDAMAFVTRLARFPTGLALDVPSERLYYVDDEHVYGVRLDGKGRFVRPKLTQYHPYSLAVFESYMYVSDWTKNQVMSIFKTYPFHSLSRVIASADSPIYGIHVYHPLMVKTTNTACDNHNCSDICVLSGVGTHTCMCAEGRRMYEGTTCGPISYQDMPEFLIVGAGAAFTRVRYNTHGNPETRATTFDIGSVQAMAYNNNARVLYLFDGQRKTINSITMNDFTNGVTKLMVIQSLENVVDMDFDYTSDNLYFAEAHHQMIEVMATREGKRAIVYRFRAQEVPIALCVVSDYGRMLVAIVDKERNDKIFIESIGLDGRNRTRIMHTGLKGPHVRLRYSQDTDTVYVSDEGNGIIYSMHPEGTGREIFRETSTTITSMAVSDTQVFWTDRRTPKLFWANIHDTTAHVRRIQFSMFPPGKQLYLQSTFPVPHLQTPMLQHPCFREHPCTHVCTQTVHPPSLPRGYTCLCPPGMVLLGNTCEDIRTCEPHEMYCHDSNFCVVATRCDGRHECPMGEDEVGCENVPFQCPSNEKLCEGVCVSNNVQCTGPVHSNFTCDAEQFKCATVDTCVPRLAQCDAQQDCPDNSDEQAHLCTVIACQENEVRCGTGPCILKTWRCDGELDCPDGSDEVGCEKTTCNPNDYQCHNGECIPISQRCDGTQDCNDYSDEEDCEDADVTVIGGEVEPLCGDNEYTCQLNRSICLPLSARCNRKVECPGGTDEKGCSNVCPLSSFQCAREFHCIPRRLQCDGVEHCQDGSDEDIRLCSSASQSFPIVPQEACELGFRCKTGECIEWSEVCDQRAHCFDRSDEGGACATACEAHLCPQLCQPTPTGATCLCPAGYGMNMSANRCEDIDECAAEDEPCSQICHNFDGSFACSCYIGFSLRSDRRSCKATTGNMSLLYVTNNSVRSKTLDGRDTLVYNNPKMARIDDIDFDSRKNRLYLTSMELGQLVEVRSGAEVMVVNNIGKPTKMALEWITDNVYFADDTAGARCLRVCNLRRQRCARLQPIPEPYTVTALKVDPYSKQLVYCLSRDNDSVLWTSSLRGADARAAGSVRGGCAALALDTRRRRVYVAQHSPPAVSWRPYGETKETIIYTGAHKQAPRSLQLFEDSIYFLAGDSFRLSRCQTRGRKPCAPYTFRVFDASAFVVRHASTQRDDVTDYCGARRCAGVCVLARYGAECVCAGGEPEADALTCVREDAVKTAQFIGASQSDFLATGWIFGIAFLVILLVSGLAAASWSHFSRKRVRPARLEGPAVRFVNPLGAEYEEDPTVEIPSSHVYSSSESLRRRLQAVESSAAPATPSFLRQMATTCRHSMQSACESVGRRLKKIRQPQHRLSMEFPVPETGDFTEGSDNENQDTAQLVATR